MSEDRVSLRFDTFQGFLEACSDRVSEEGIFLATEAIRPVGSTVDFELGLDADFPLLRGSGEVVRVVEPNGEGETPGMAVRYERTDEATATLARKIAERQRTRTGTAFQLGPAPAEEPAATAASLATQKVDALISDVPEPLPEIEAGQPAATGEFETERIEPEALEAEPPETEPARAEAFETEAIAPEALETPSPGEAAVAVAPSARRGRGGLWATLGLIAVLTGAAYWQRGFLLEKLGGRSPAGAPVRASEPPSPPAPGAGAATPVPSDSRKPGRAAAPSAVETEAPAAGAPEVEATAVPEAPAGPETVGAPAPSGPLSRIDEIRWQATGGATLLRLMADGAFPTDADRVERLEDPPRLLLKIAGVTTPLPSPTVAVGSEEVVGVRTALHGSPPETALHLVVDLADPTAQVTSIETDGAVLQLQISSSAISP